MKTKKIKSKLIKGIFLLFVILFLNLVSSAHIGISPSNVVFKEVLREGYAERNITITSNSETPIKVNIEPRGEISEWMEFSETQFQVSRQKPYQLRVSVTPPFDVPNANYTGFIRATTDGSGTVQENQAVSFVKAALDLTVLVEITDIEYFSCNVKNYQIFSAEKGDDILIKLAISNTGNTRINPLISMEIWDQEQLNIIKKIDYSQTRIIPTTTETLFIKIPTNDMEIGQYWIDVSAIDCLDSRLLTFDVYEPGKLKANGILKSLFSKVWAEQGETLVINAIFENTGEKSVEAIFKGVITYQDKIIQLLESPKTLVEIQEDETFQFYFTPQKPGKYVVS